MNITNNRAVMIFKNENKYVVGLSKKKQNGEYENAYIKIEFNKDVELEDKTLIEIKNAWLSFYNWEYEGKKGTTYFIKCSEFEVLGEAPNPYKEFKEEHQEEFEMKDEEGFDLPF